MKKRLKTLQRHLSQVGKFARQQAMSLPIRSKEQQNIPIHPCHELLMARDGGLVDIDKALATLDQLILDQIAKEEACDACLLKYPA